ncbi:MAG: aldolase/citrate lyase family protein [Burkholderiales bacterium]|jgi:2-keto-3-deoxy-L-rhamnonate aldolase RhmA
MQIVGNPARERLVRDELAVGIGVRAVRGVEIAPIMATAGYDWLFIDLEHGATSIETAASISVAALSAGITPLVRVPQGDLNLGTRCLDAGALGIVMPHVDTVEQAKAMVNAFRFAPLGHRSIAGNYAQLRFAPGAAGDTVKALNETTLVVAMMETPQAIENADAIAALPGVDALLMGTNDLCLEMDIPGQIGHKRVIDAVDKVVSACRKHGKWPGLGGVYTKELLEPYIARGMRLILAGNDVSLLMSAARDHAKFVRGCK